MEQQQNTPQQQQNNTPPKKDVYAIRSYWLLLPISLGILAYILANSDCVISWHGILEKIGIEDKERFTRLFTWCTLATVTVLITKIIKR